LLEFRCHEIPSDELNSPKALVEGPIQSILATNPVMIQFGWGGLVELATPEHEPKTTAGQLSIIRNVGFGAA
jgi:hypothetical protein